MNYSPVPTILDVWQYVEPRFGGVGPAAASLAAAVERSSHWTFQQIAFCDPSETQLADGIRPDVKLIKIRGLRPWVDSKLRIALRNQVASSDLCHVHGVWQPQSLAVQSLAFKLRKPVIASAHGMLESWELSHKRLRKSVYSLLFERRSISRSMCLRALSSEEANDYRRFGLKCPIAVVPNGVTPLTRTDGSLLFARFPYLKDKRIVLFLSRIHHKKGILNLIRAWPSIKRDVADGHLLIAGPEYPEAAAEGREIILETQVSDSVTFCGTLKGDIKLDALSVAKCFCLPSYSEGLSMAVLEALSIGLPVVITAACNVDGVFQAGAGLVSSNEPGSLADAISHVLQLSESDWGAMSGAATRLASGPFNWLDIGKKMHLVYGWMLGGYKPDFVID